MITGEDEILLEDCKKRIEARLGWGNSESWSHQDFEELSQNIFEVTAVNLSPTTLKRIWGKLKYDSAPTHTTLNTLARFIGFEHWRDFRQQQNAGKELTAITDSFQKIEDTTPVEKPKKPKLSVITGLVFIAIVVVWFFLAAQPEVAQQNIPGVYQFSSKKIVSLGLPNSVVFEYDARSCKTDSLFIQQSWNKNLRSKVSKNQRHHTSIYYYPGFFQAKLVACNQIVKEHDVFIQTDGWLTMIERNPVPVYFKKAEGIRDGKLGLSVDQLSSHHVALQPDPPFVFYANVREFDNVKTDNFIFETSVKNTFSEGASICQKTEIQLLCEGSMVLIPLSAKGCISENNLFCLGRYWPGKENDLSGFGVNGNDFTKIRLEIANGRAKFFVNDKLVYQIDGITLQSKIKGIVYRFQGTGLVDWVKLMKGNGDVVYEDGF